MVGYRSGFVALLGRPNVGKSTLLNRVLGHKVAITSSRPNTTRRAVRGVLHRPDAQAVLVDTPGLHRPRTALGERLNERVSHALEDIDVAVCVLDATQAVGPGDRIVLERAAEAVRRPEAAGGPGELVGMVVVVNKVDVAAPAQVLERLAEAAAVLEGAGAGLAGPGPARTGARAGAGPNRGPKRADAGVAVDRGVAYYPVSALAGQGVDELVDAVLRRLPEGPPYFPPDMVSDQPEAFWVAELVREQLLARVRDELPHSIACRVTEWEWPRVRVEVVVERESQKAIVIGRGGSVLKAVGTAVRAQLPPGAFLELHVRVEPRWQQRSELIERLGY